MNSFLDPLVDVLGVHAAAGLRADINRQNAMHSTGPRTAVGKNKSSGNALKLGLYAKHSFLPNEDRESYEILGAELRNRFRPACPAELELVVTLRDAEWRLRRISDIEFDLFSITTQETLVAMETENESFKLTPENIRLARALSFRENLNLFTRVAGQRNRLQRTVDKTTAALRNRTAQPEAEFSAAPAPPEPVAEPVAEPALEPAPPPSAPPNGFVPSKMPKFSGPMKEVHRKQWLRTQRQHAAAAAH